MDENQKGLAPLFRMASRLGVSEAWLRREVEAGRVPIAGGTVARPLFDLAEVEHVFLDRARALGFQSVRPIRRRPTKGASEVSYRATWALGRFIEALDTGAGGVAVYALDVLERAGVRVTVDHKPFCGEARKEVSGE